VDAIVAQGIEAGGHRGMFDPSAPDERLSTLVLLQRLRRETRLPLIAAGGLMDGAGIRAALALGAVAAQLGTAFVLCPESAADAAYRAALQGERAEHTRLTSVLSGRPARGLLSPFIAEGEQLPAGLRRRPTRGPTTPASSCMPPPAAGATATTPPITQPIGPARARRWPVPCRRRR
jgi:nitronate monooxygenase